MKTKRRACLKSHRYSVSIPMLTIITIAFLTLTSAGYEEQWNFDWSNIRGPIKDSIKVAEYGGITGGIGGMGRTTKKEVLRRSWIMHTATETELLQLTNYPGGTIKAIAYEGLIRKKETKQKTNLILEAMKDNKYPVYYQMGCESLCIDMSDYLIRYVLKLNQLPSSNENVFGISRADQQKIAKVYEKMKIEKVGV